MGLCRNNDVNHHNIERLVVMFLYYNNELFPCSSMCKVQLSRNQINNSLSTAVNILLNAKQYLRVLRFDKIVPISCFFVAQFPACMMCNG